MNDARADLLARAARGERAALHDLLVAHLPSISAFVRARVGALVRHKESCSDIAQSACLEALQELSGFEFRGEQEFRAWLFKHAHHKIVAKARRYAAEKRDAAREVPFVHEHTNESDAALAACYVSVCSPSRHAIGREALAAFEQALAGLPDEWREAISLYRIAGLPYDEVARVMQRSEGAVRNLVYRGLARLSSSLVDPERGIDG